MKTIFVVRRHAICIDYQPRNVETQIEEHEIIRETPKGMRLKFMNGNSNAVYLHEHYHFFPSRLEALEHLANQANTVAAELEQIKLEAVRVLCDVHDLIRAEKLR